MSSHTTMDQLEYCAVEALKILLGDVSVIKLTELQRAVTGPGQAIGVVAHIQVLGRSHKLALAVKASADPGYLRSALPSVSGSSAQLGDDVTPVLFAPYLSPEAQSVCKENQTAFFDLEGNARLAVGEVFIGKRNQPQQQANRAAESSIQKTVRPGGRAKVQHMPAARPHVALSA